MTTDHTLVLDNEAAQALADVRHPKHRSVIAYVDARARRSGRRRQAPSILVPAAVRVEAELDRRSPSTTALGRMRVRDVPLDRHRTDRAVAMRIQAGGSTVDACVAEVAASEPGPVTVLTADLTDVPALLAAADSGALVQRV